METEGPKCACAHDEKTHERLFDARFGAWYDNCTVCGCCFLSRDQSWPTPD